jgi:dihydroorotate dehydrogenase
MPGWYEAVVRPLFFTLPPERAHAISLGMVRLVGALPPLGWAMRAFFAAPDCPVEAFGLHFSNPVGLAAGYDKDGFGWRGLAYLGFGHIELGTITLRSQPGNPQPRLFRLPAEQGLINRMGFPGKGAQFVAQRLHPNRPPGLVLGVNLGKNKDTPLEEAVNDYLPLVDIFASLSDYLAINVSSPNTVGLRRLQARQELERLLTPLAQRRSEVQKKLGRKVPVLVKLAPDLSDDELDDALQAIIEAGMDGVIATNTTISREGVNSPLGGEAGGLSGAPLRQRSLDMVRKIVARSKLPVIGVGGIMGSADAQAHLDAGACLVQVYTGLVYAGPGLVKKIVGELKAC